MIMNNDERREENIGALTAEDPSKDGRLADGTFAPGNAIGARGRPQGSKHKATLAVEALLDGEIETITRKVVEKAKEGDLLAARLCLERVMPPAKSRRVNLDLPKIETPQDLVVALAEVIDAMGAGEIALDEAAVVAGVLEAKRKAIETVELERRLAALEQRSGTNGGKS
jgi:hypothetical protein